MEQTALFARVNDSIRELASTASTATDTWDFYCECPDIGCRATVQLSVVEFDTRRAASPPVPIYAAVHGGCGPNARRSDQAPLVRQATVPAPGA